MQQREVKRNGDDAVNRAYVSVFVGVLSVCSGCGMGKPSMFGGGRWLRPPEPNVWINPFPHCTHDLTSSEAREEKLLPLSFAEAWKAATTAAGKSGIVSEVEENDNAIAFFDSNFYCQVIKLEPAGDGTRVIVSGGQMRGFHSGNKPQDINRRPARTLEALSQEAVGGKKWVHILGSPGISHAP